MIMSVTLIFATPFLYVVCKVVCRFYTLFSEYYQTH